jgi:purine-nucleoside phosphorylase
MSTTIMERCRAASDAVRGLVPGFPAIGVVLGSGLGAFAESLTDGIALPYDRIPHFPAPTVEGHAGRLVVGQVQGVPVAVLQGRFHFYEGHDLETVTLPIRVLKLLGVRSLILTAAVGGIHGNAGPGSLVLVTDHLNLLGANPLRGPNDAAFGPRFPDMSEVYSRRLCHAAHAEARRLGMALADGVYACMPGPSYETPAEIRALRALGADVVGMSVVPEAILARHAGMETAALAVVSNWAAGMAPRPITHEEVLAAGEKAGPSLAALLGALIVRIGSQSVDSPG